jgi:hypothetical protein
MDGRYLSSSLSGSRLRIRTREDNPKSGAGAWGSLELKGRIQ